MIGTPPFLRCCDPVSGVMQVICSQELHPEAAKTAYVAAGSRWVIVLTSNLILSCFLSRNLRQHTIEPQKTCKPHRGRLAGTGLSLDEWRYLVVTRSSCESPSIKTFRWGRRCSFRCQPRSLES